MKLAELLERKGSHAVMVPASASVGMAVRTMHEQRVGSVVIPSDTGEPLGILTERDLIRLYAQGKSDFENVLVRDCMTTEMEIGHPEDKMDEVLSLMTEKRFRHIPVVQDDKIVGVISIGDLVKAKLEETSYEAQALREYINS